MASGLGVVAGAAAERLMRAASGPWTALPSMPSPRHSFGMAALGNRIHIVAGDVQSAMVPAPPGVSIATSAHVAFEVES